MRHFDFWTSDGHHSSEAERVTGLTIETAATEYAKKHFPEGEGICEFEGWEVSQDGAVSVGPKFRVTVETASTLTVSVT